MTASGPDRGELWLADLDPARSGEQGGTGPVLVLSTGAFNAWPVGLTVVVPLTTRERGFPHHIRIDGGGLANASYAMPEYVRSVSQQRLTRRLGSAGPAPVAEVGDWVRRITGL